MASSVGGAERARRPLQENVRGGKDDDFLMRKMARMKLSSRAFSFGEVFFPKKPNDPFGEYRKYLEDTPGTSGVRPFTYQGPELDEACIDLSLTHYQHIPPAYLEMFKKIVDLRLSGSLVSDFPPCLLRQPIRALDLKHCNPNLVVELLTDLKYPQHPDGGMSATPVAFPFTNNLLSLDVSHVPLTSDQSGSVFEFFRFLECIFMKNCDLKVFPVDLQTYPVGPKCLDFSNNSIREIPKEVFQFGSHNLFHVDIEREDPEGVLGLLARDEGVAEGHIKEVSPSVFCGVEKQGQGRVLHIDMRGNPLRKKMYKIFDRVPRVKISDKHQVVCFPGNLYIYTDLPQPNASMLKV